MFLAGIDAVVISLPRSHQRLQAFQQRLGRTAEHVEPIRGIDGQSLDLEALVQGGILSNSALHWPRGQIGCALSHLRCLLRCLKREQPLLIFEDDALMPPDWEEQLAALLRQAPDDWELLLLGWNLDSCLQIGWQEGISMSALFRPRFPSPSTLHAALTAPTTRQWHRLEKGLGLAGYLLSPRGAAQILAWSLPLRTLPIQANELPERPCFSLDGQLNSFYPQLSAWVCMPPLVLGANHKPSSLTAS